MTIKEINQLEIEILEYLNEKGIDVEDYGLYGKEPNGIHTNNFDPEFPKIMKDKGMKPSLADIKDALENLELNAYLHCEKKDITASIAEGELRTHWKKYRITIEGKKYLRRIKEMIKK